MRIPKASVGQLQTSCSHGLMHRTKSYRVVTPENAFRRLCSCKVAAAQAPPTAEEQPEPPASRREILFTSAAASCSFLGAPPAWASEQEQPVVSGDATVPPQAKNKLSEASCWQLQSPCSALSNSVAAVVSCCCTAEGYVNAPAQFLRNRQRANGGELVLAPIRGARLRLEVIAAFLLLYWHSFLHSQGLHHQVQSI